MFQIFDDAVETGAGAERIALLRAELARRGLHGFLVPRADEHQGEYVPASAERLKWLTGFNGSAGLAIVLADKAAIFVDGRYTLQVRDQVDVSVFEPKSLMEEPPASWLEGELSHGARIGFDPWLHTPDAVARYRKAVEKAGAELVACETNPLDAVWADRPEPPLAVAQVHDLAYAGESAEEKLDRLAAGLREAEADAAVLTLPDSIAWAFNIRGQDVPHTPFALSFAILHNDGRADWFIEQEKLDDEVRAHLGNRITAMPKDAFADALDALGATEKTVRLELGSAPEWVRFRLEAAGAAVQAGADPCALPKACKNAQEVAGARAAHARDGIALTRFLAWLEAHAPSGEVDEVGAARKLEALRAETGALKDLSFDTISGAGPHGAVVHYRVTRSTARKLHPGELYLVDSGGQYLDGTTDVTRTVAVGEPSADQKRHFTLVLKGHIALATARFPKGTSGAQLDALARMDLWKAGLDFDHGTGHGVGSYLSVHEGPQRISKLGHEPLQPGMILSNEPGFYKADAYGIRIENLMVVTAPSLVEGGERPMLGFETLTLAPIDRRLIVLDLLTREERDWLDAYHARVRENASAALDEETRAWLEQATAPL